jgi:hypothetical protein
VQTTSHGADLLARLATAPGLYRGRGDGPESGPFIARLSLASVVRGRAVTLDYEATCDRDGLQHVEHSVLVASESGRLELHVVCLGVPGMVRFVQTATGEFASYDGPIAAKIGLTAPHAGSLTYAWSWSRDESEPREQSRAELHRTS